MKPTTRSLVAGLALAATGLAAFAQTPPPAAPAGGMHMHGMQGGRAPADPARMEERRQRMEARMAQRQAELKQKLGITPAQEGAWAAWTGTMKPAARPAQRPNREEFARLTTPQRIDRMRELRAERTARMDARMNATKTLYAALTPAQQKVFDEQSLRMSGRRGEHRGDHKGGHHGGHRS